MKKVYTAIGLMSGTSLDGIDAALLETDGYQFVNPLGFVSMPYDEQTRTAIRGALGKRENDEGASEVGRSVTLAHIEVVKKLLIDTKRSASDIDVVGFHGQTILHNPNIGETVQLGDGAMLARELGIDVVNKIRNEDVAAGGQGAPLLPLYHRARVMAGDFSYPVAVLNIGGVGNVTWIGAPSRHPREGGDILAFDTGPGNALLDDFVRERIGDPYDRGGALARCGTPNQFILHNATIGGEGGAEKADGYKTDGCKADGYAAYFSKKPPKSLDRDEWGCVVEAVQNLSTEDGAATLASFTVEAIKRGMEHFPQAPALWLVTGGGRHNHYIMHGLRNVLGAPVRTVDDYGWNGDALEAEGFAYLAVRSLLGEPLSLPATTGVPAPQIGGTLHKVT